MERTLAEHLVNDLYALDKTLNDIAALVETIPK